MLNLLSSVSAWYSLRLLYMPYVVTHTLNFGVFLLPFIFLNYNIELHTNLRRTFLFMLLGVGSVNLCTGFFNHPASMYVQIKTINISNICTSADSLPSNQFLWYHTISLFVGHHRHKFSLNQPETNDSPSGNDNFKYNLPTIMCNRESFRLVLRYAELSGSWKKTFKNINRLKVYPNTREGSWLKIILHADLTKRKTNI